MFQIIYITEPNLILNICCSSYNFTTRKIRTDSSFPNPNNQRTSHYYQVLQTSIITITDVII